MVQSASILPSIFTFSNGCYLVTQGGGNFPFISQQGLVVALNNVNLISAINYFYKKATLEIKHFQHLKNYQNISKDKFGILYYTGRILPSQEFDDIFCCCTTIFSNLSFFLNNNIQDTYKQQDFTAK